jgi:hypothetical protein
VPVAHQALHVAKTKAGNVENEKARPRRRDDALERAPELGFVGEHLVAEQGHLVPADLLR